MSDKRLLARAIAADSAMMALGHETLACEGGTIVRDRRLPRVHDANMVDCVRCSTVAELDRLLQRADVELSASPHRKVRVDGLTPPIVAARLAYDDYAIWGESLLMVLDGPLGAEPRPLEIREISADADWEALHALRALDWHESGPPLPPAVKQELLVQLTANMRARTPPFRFWLGVVDARPCGYFSSWPGVDGMGVVEHLFTHPDYRRRGVATALIAHAVADARERGADAVAISGRSDDWPKRLYARLGFRPLATTRSYVKYLDGAA